MKKFNDWAIAADWAHSVKRSLEPSGDTLESDVVESWTDGSTKVEIIRDVEVHFAVHKYEERPDVEVEVAVYKVAVGSFANFDNDYGIEHFDSKAECYARLDEYKSGKPILA